MKKIFDAVKFGQKLKNLRKQMGLNQAEFIAKIDIDVSQGAYSAWENGNRIPDPDVLIAISNTCGVTVDWLLEPSNNYSLDAPIVDTSLLVNDVNTVYLKQIPIITKVQGGDPRLIYREDNIDGKTVLPPGIIADFAVIVEGDSMYNPSSPKSIAPGDYVFCSTNETALPGDLVVLLTSEGRQLLKQYYKNIGEDKKEFKSFNPDYPEFHLHNDQIEIMLRVVYHQPKGIKY